MIRRPPRSTLFPFSSDLGGSRIIKSEEPTSEHHHPFPPRRSSDLMIRRPPRSEEQGKSNDTATTEIYTLSLLFRSRWSPYHFDLVQPTRLCHEVCPAGGIADGF